MKGAIVYFGDWGYCRQVAEMVIKGLLEKGHEVALLEPDGRLPDEVEFLVLGAPTQLGKLPSSIRKFVKKQVDERWKERPFVAFSTGDYRQVDKGERQAADIIHEELSARGLVELAPALKLGTASMKGVLVEGALMSAYRFGLEIGGNLREPKEAEQEQ